MSVEQYVIAYLAGLFDGEGCVFIGWCGKQFRMSLVVGNCDRRVLEMFQMAFGGSISITNQKKRRPVGQWTISSHGAEKAARVLREFCVVKREQLDHFIEARETLDLTRGRQLTDYQRESRDCVISELREIRYSGEFNVC